MAKKNADTRTAANNDDPNAVDLYAIARESVNPSETGEAGKMTYQSTTMENAELQRQIAERNLRQNADTMSATELREAAEALGVDLSDAKTKDAVRSAALDAVSSDNNETGAE